MYNSSDDAFAAYDTYRQVAANQEIATQLMAPTFIVRLLDRTSARGRQGTLLMMIYPGPPPTYVSLWNSRDTDVRIRVV